MFACGSMDLGPGVAVFLFLVAAVWLMCIVSAVANLFLIVSLNASKRFAQINVGIFCIYTILTVAWVSGGLNQIMYNWLEMVPIIGIPFLPIAHLIYLLCVRRKLKTNENNIARQNVKKSVSDDGHKS